MLDVQIGYGPQEPPPGKIETTSFPRSHFIVTSPVWNLKATDHVFLMYELMVDVFMAKNGSFPVNLIVILHHQGESKSYLRHRFSL